MDYKFVVLLRFEEGLLRKPYMLASISETEFFNQSIDGNRCIKLKFLMVSKKRFI
jgi:hypothetical protein